MTHGLGVFLKIRCTQTRIWDVKIPNELLTADSNIIILTSIVHTFISDLLHFYMYKCFACTCICVPLACLLPSEARPPGTGTTNNCEPLCGG